LPENTQRALKIKWRNFNLRIKYFGLWFLKRIDEEIVLPVLTWFWHLLAKKIKPEKPPKSIDADWKMQALEDFRQWLEELPDTKPASESVSLESCDLYTLLSEFSALRQEIRLQNRQQIKSADTVHDVVALFQDAEQLFKAKAQQLDLFYDNIRLSCEKKTVTEFFDVRDALVRGKSAVENIVKKKSLFRPLPKGINGALEGYEMALRRMDKALAALHVQPIETVGRIFDPKSMKAIGQKADPVFQTGIVIEEVSGGFMRDGEILKTAHVIVAQ
jgi:molecular chaperone GrpE